MAAEDDFAAFLAEIQTTESVATDAAPATEEADAGEKRPRAAEDEQAPTATEEGASAPVLKKARVVVARAKPQVFQAPPQPAAEEVVVQHQTGRADYNTYGPAGGSGGAASSSSYNKPAPRATGPSYGGSFAGPSSHAEAYGKGPAQPGSFGGGGPGGAPGAQEKKKVFVRVGAGETWTDPTLSEWPENDFRLFCGDLGNEISDEMLANAFKQYSSFAKAKVVREKGSGKSKGYGFVSFLDPFDGLKAYREMNNKYLGSRPLKLRKSEWKERNLTEVRKKEKSKKKFLKQLGIS